MKIRSIDLNLDAGESFEALNDGSEEKLYQIVTSVNIACGGHTGTETTMAKAVELASKYNLRIGAHPSFPDQENFGRQILKMPEQELTDSLISQIEDLKSIVQHQGLKLSHIKPHGALYNLAANDPSAARAVIQSVLAVDKNLVVVGLAGSAFLNWCREAGLRAVAEAFSDRRYESDGTLRARKFSDALIEDSEWAAKQAVQIASHQPFAAVDGREILVQADTLCVHGDTPYALSHARAVRGALESAGIVIRAWS